MLNWIAIWVGTYLVRPRRPAPEQRRTRRCRSRTTSPSRRKLPVFWGDQDLQGAAHRLLHRARGARRLLAAPEPDDARLRGARGRLQPRRGALRRHQRAQEPDPRDGDLGRVRRPRGRPRHARLPLPLRRLRHPGLGGRLPRHRGRAARPQHRRRRRPGRAPLRRAALRHEPRPAVERRSTRGSRATSPT